MFENIRSNKIKSGVIISIFILMITLIVYYICMMFDLGSISILIALGISIISAIASYWNCDKAVLAVNHARPATQEEYQQFNNIIDGLMVSSGLSHRPDLYVIDDAQPNAFATGRDPEHAVICVTSALLDKLNYYELEGVLAHEMSHIYNYDIRLSAVVTVMVGMVVMLSDMFTRTFLFSNRDREGRGNAILMVVGLICLILSPIFAQLLQLAVSRKREFLADATAVKFTRNPDGLISALIKISEDPNELSVANKATENMYIANPFRKENVKNLFSTHPSIEDRIEALRNFK